MKRLLTLSCGIASIVCLLAAPALRAQSLLSGKTPANLGTPPAGWQVLATQDFESGGVGPNEELAFTDISTAWAHGGTHSMRETISANGGGNQSPGGHWGLHTGSLNCCTNGDIYMSWYSYLSSGANSNTEGFFAELLTNDRQTQALIMDTQGGTGSSANLWFSPQAGAGSIDCANGFEDSGLAQNCGFYGARWDLNIGVSEQEELWIHPSTCTGGTPNNDGFVVFYINGQQVYRIDANNSADRTNPMGGNINGCTDMSNHPDIDVGGIWTYFNSNPTTWYKYIDDIIILSRAGGAPAPSVGFSPSSYTFPNQNITTSSSPQAITLTNTGNATLSISSINLTGGNAGDFSKTTTCGSTVAAQATCAINVTFTPTATGNRVAAVSVTDNAGGSPHTVLLAGMGVNPASSGISLSASSIAFPGTVTSVTSSAVDVTVTSTGTANLAIPTITFTGTNPTNFAVSSTTCPTSATLATNSTCVIHVTFTPSATGARSATMNVNDNAPGSPHLVTLTGTGLSGAASFASIAPSTSFNFNGQALATSSSGKVFTLTNTGGVNLTFTSIVVGGANSADFSKVDTCLPGPLTAGSNCTVTMSFTPHATGSRSATVTLTTNASNSPTVITLLGTGTAAAPSTTAQPQTPDVANIPRLQPANVAWVQGVGPGYWATAGSGLTLNLTSGTSWCAGVIVNYTGSTLTMTDNTTNYVYLNTASSCVPAVKTSAFVVADIPVATVVTSSGVITQISDDRTTTSTGSAASGQHNSGDYSCAMVTGCGTSNTTTMHLHEEFCGGAAGPLTYSDESPVKTSIGELGWNIGSSLDAGLSYQLVNPIVANHPCIASFGTTSGSDWDYLVLGDTTNKYANPTTYTFDWNGTLKNANIHSGELRWGMFTNFGTQNGQGVWFDTTQTGSTTNWFCQAKDGSGTTSVDSGILADTTWHNLEIVASASSTVVYKIDGSQVCSISTNVPNQNVAAGMEIIGNGSGGAVFNVDYADLTITVSRQ